jgi:hypothetical protein
MKFIIHARWSGTVIDIVEKILKDNGRWNELLAIYGI